MRSVHLIEAVAGHCGCGGSWPHSAACVECSARFAALQALTELTETVAPECMNGELLDGTRGDPNRQLPPAKVAIIERAIELMGSSLERAKREHPSGPTGVVVT